MAIVWEQLEKQLAELHDRLMDASLDSQTRQALQRKHAHLGQVLEKHKEIKELEKLLLDLRVQAEQTTDKELQTLFNDEIAVTHQKLQHIQQELDDILYPADPLDNRSVFLEVRAGTGGQEAALFAANLLKMYTNYALQKHWKVSLVDESTTDLGGIREATLHIQGNNVYGHLKRESGVHRVQRVPKTETQGRVHTSTATVAVLPEAQEVDVVINPSDLRIDTYRAGGAGGQHVNKTDSAVRITHIPTGIFVACQDDRSQHKNKAKAMKMLQSRLLSAQREKEEAELAKKRKEMVGGGMRAEKVRTYNFPQNRVTDHQINLTLQKLDLIIEGDLDDIVQAHIIQDREQRKKYSIFE